MYKLDWDIFGNVGKAHQMELRVRWEFKDIIKVHILKIVIPLISLEFFLDRMIIIKMGEIIIS